VPRWLAENWLASQPCALIRTAPMKTVEKIMNLYSQLCTRRCTPEPLGGKKSKWIGVHTGSVSKQFAISENFPAEAFMWLYVADDDKALA